MESYRSEEKAIQRISLADEESEFNLILSGGSGHLTELEIVPLFKNVAKIQPAFGRGLHGCRPRG